MLSQVSRSPLGVCLQSPNGVLIRRKRTYIQPISGCYSFHRQLVSGPGHQAFPPGSASFLHTVSFNAIAAGSDFIRMDDDLDPTKSNLYISKQRAGFTYTLASEYPIWKKFYLFTHFKAIGINPKQPRIYISAIDNHNLYGDIDPKASFDWENDLNYLLADNVAVLTTASNFIDNTITEIPYDILEPYFGHNVSIVIGDASDFDNTYIAGSRANTFVSDGGQLYNINFPLNDLINGTTCHQPVISVR